MFTQVTFRDVPVSDALSATAQALAARLSRRFSRITGCRVVVSRPHHRGQQGSLYRVRIDLTVPRGEIVVNREHRFDHAHEDAHVALRGAFAAARRGLTELAERRRLAARPARTRRAAAVRAGVMSRAGA